MGVMSDLGYLFEAVFVPSGTGFEAGVPDLGACAQGDDLMDAAYMAQGLVESRDTAAWAPLFAVPSTAGHATSD